MADADFYSLMMGDEPTAQEQSKAMVAALRGQKRQADIQQQFGILGQFSGDRVLGQAGKSLLSAADQGYGRAQQGEEQLARAPGLRLALAQQQAGLKRSGLDLEQAQLERDEGNAPASSTYGQLATKFGVQLPQGTTNRQAKTFLDMAEKAYSAEMRAREIALNREAMRGRQGQEATDKHDKEIESDVQKLGKDSEETAQLRGDLTTLVGAAKGDSIPGFGQIAGRLPNFFTSDEGIKTRQAAKRIMQNIMHKLSGSAVSEAELGRALEARGLGDTASPEQFKLGVKALSQEANDTFQRTEAKYKPEVVQRFHGRGGVTSQDVAPLMKEASGLVQPDSSVSVKERRQLADGRVIELLSDGTKRLAQ